MPDDRMFHKCLGHSQKVNSLSDFEDIVWRTYIQAADDFGVMRFLPLPLQDASDRLSKRSPRVVQRALEAVAGAGLIFTFSHQGQTFCYQRTWQRYQKVEYPRTTIQPRPPENKLAECCELTRHLFQFHPGGKRVPAPKDSGNLPVVLPESYGNLPGIILESSGSIPVPHAGARASTANANANGEWLMAEGGARGADATEPSERGLPMRAGDFVERYRELHEKYRGVAYIGNPRKDYEEALLLVQAHDDQTLDQLATVFLNADDDFARNGTATVGKFRSRATWCHERLNAEKKRRGIA